MIYFKIQKTTVTRFLSNNGQMEYKVSDNFINGEKEYGTVSQEAAQKDEPTQTSIGGQFDTQISN